MITNKQEYYKEIQDISYDIWAEALEQTDCDKDRAERLVDLAHEIVDGHQWVMYYQYHDQVLRYSKNNEAYLDIHDNESLGQCVRDSGSGGLNSLMTYWAMQQDVTDTIYELLAA